MSDTPSVPLPPLRGRRLVIVEDDLAVRRAMRFALEEAGAAVEEAVDGLEALRQVGVQRLDAVVLDLRLPGPDGVRLLRRIRRRVDVPVVVATATRDARVHADAIAAGAADCLIKPFSAEALVAAVRAALPG